MFIKQDPMRRVLYSLVPIFLWSTYLYGWRVVALTGFVFILGILAEYIFEKGRNKKVSEAVLVTCALYALSLPPAVPFWAAGVGILFAVIFGKEVFGGFGRNTYNPAIIGRTFAYISFPLMFQTTWMIPGQFGWGGGMNLLIQGSTFPEAVFMLLLAAALYGFSLKNAGRTKRMIAGVTVAVLITIVFYVAIAYSFPYTKGLRIPINEIDAIAMATPIEVFRGLAQENSWHYQAHFFGLPLGDLAQNGTWNLFFGFRIGAIGESAILLILLAGVYLLWTKTANPRPMIWTLVSAAGLTAVFYYTGMMESRFPLLGVKPDLAGQLADIAGFLMAGSLVFAAVFMATDPVSAPKKPLAQHLYGIIIGSLTITIRVFAGFPEGVSFAILTANTFAALLDEIVPSAKKGTSTKKTEAKTSLAGEGGAS